MEENLNLLKIQKGLNFFNEREPQHFSKGGQLKNK
jgi:hypothetical protein